MTMDITGEGAESAQEPPMSANAAASEDGPRGHEAPRSGGAVDVAPMQGGTAAAVLIGANGVAPEVQEAAVLTAAEARQIIDVARAQAKDAAKRLATAEALVRGSGDGGVEEHKGDEGDVAAARLVAVQVAGDEVLATTMRLEELLESHTKLLKKHEADLQAQQQVLLNQELVLHEHNMVTALWAEQRKGTCVVSAADSARQKADLVCFRKLGRPAQGFIVARVVALETARRETVRAEALAGAAGTYLHFQISLAAIPNADADWNSRVRKCSDTKVGEVQREQMRMQLMQQALTTLADPSCGNRFALVFRNSVCHSSLADAQQGKFCVPAGSEDGKLCEEKVRPERVFAVAFGGVTCALRVTRVRSPAEPVVLTVKVTGPGAGTLLQVQIMHALGAHLPLDPCACVEVAPAFAVQPPSYAMRAGVGTMAPAARLTGLLQALQPASDCAAPVPGVGTSRPASVARAFNVRVPYGAAQQAPSRLVLTDSRGRAVALLQLTGPGIADCAECGCCGHFGGCHPNPRDLNSLRVALSGLPSPPRSGAARRKAPPPVAAPSGAKDAGWTVVSGKSKSKGAPKGPKHLLKKPGAAGGTAPRPKQKQSSTRSKVGTQAHIAGRAAQASQPPLNPPVAPVLPVLVLVQEEAAPAAGHAEPPQPEVAPPPGVADAQVAADASRAVAPAALRETARSPSASPAAKSAAAQADEARSPVSKGVQAESVAMDVVLDAAGLNLKRRATGTPRSESPREPPTEQASHSPQRRRSGPGPSPSKRSNSGERSMPTLGGDMHPSQYSMDCADDGVLQSQPQPEHNGAATGLGAPPPSQS